MRDDAFCGIYYRADSRFAPSQWETALLCNDVSHGLGTNLKSALYYIRHSHWLSSIYLLRMSWHIFGAREPARIVFNCDRRISGRKIFHTNKTLPNNVTPLDCSMEIRKLHQRSLKSKLYSTTDYNKLIQPGRLLNQCKIVFLLIQLND